MSAAGHEKAARVGRPMVLAEAQRRALVMDAAERVFLARGYVAATMHAIAVEARMSKKTIYQVFPSKLALFDALLADRVLGVPVAPDLPDSSQEDSLVNVVAAIAGMLLRPDRMGLIRLVIVDGQASPELTTAFDRLRMAKDLNAMEVWLQREQAQGRLRRGDVAEDARLLFGMTIAEPLLQALVRAPRPLSEPPLELRIREAVRIFLRGLGARLAADGITAVSLSNEAVVPTSS